MRIRRSRSFTALVLLSVACGAPTAAPVAESHPQPASPEPDPSSVVDAPPITASGRVSLDPGHDESGTGDFDASRLERAIGTRLATFAACLGNDETGLVTLTYAIGDTGEVSVATGIGGGTSMPTRECVDSAFRNLPPFVPPPEGGSVFYTYVVRVVPSE